MIRSLCLATVALAGLSLTAAAQDAVTFRYKMGENDELIYQTSSTTKQSQSFGEMKFESNMEMNEVTLRRLEKADESGNFHIKAETKRLSIKSDLGPAGTYQYDSASSERERGTQIAEQLNPVFDALSGAQLTVVVSPRGEVISVEGYQELLADVLKDNPFGKQFTGGGSNKAAKVGMQEQYVQFSENPVKPGESWTVPFEQDLPGLGSFRGKRTYTYVGPDKVGDRATEKFTVTSEFSVDLNLEIMGNAVTGNVATTESEGEIHFDLEKGQLVSARRTDKASGMLNLTINEQQFQIPTEMTQTTTVQQLDKLPD